MNINIDLFKIEGETLSPKKGRILIAEPFLMDSYFKRAIVLLTEHNKDGTVGFVLNKPVEIAVTEVLTDFPDIDAGISIGGPVGTNTVHYLHTLGDIIPNSVKIMRGIYWGGDFEQIKLMVDAGTIDKNQIRFFLGYSGWKPAQLQNELSQNAWVVANIEPHKVLHSTMEDSWKKTLQNMGDKYRIWLNTPENANLN